MKWSAGLWAAAVIAIGCDEQAAACPVGSERVAGVCERLDGSDSLGDGSAGDSGTVEDSGRESATDGGSDRDSAEPERDAGPEREDSGPERGDAAADADLEDSGTSGPVDGETGDEDAGSDGADPEPVGPLLSSLVPSEGVLTPSFAPDELSYEVAVPFWAASIELSAEGDGEVSSTDAVFDAGTATVALEPGEERVIDLDLVSDEDTTHYEIMVRRVLPRVAGTLSPDVGGGAFGSDLVLDGDTLAVLAGGDGTVHIHERVNGDWGPASVLLTPGPTSYLGSTGDIALDGSLLAVGVPYDNTGYLDPEPPWAPADCEASQPENCSDKGGAVYLFRKTAGGWQPETKLKSPTPGGPTSRALAFGRAVALVGDRLFVGVNNDSAQRGVFGDSSLLRDDCSASLPSNCEQSSGAVLVYHRGSDGSWAAEKAIKGLDARLGFGLRVAAEGGRLYVASYASGEPYVVHVLEERAAGWEFVDELQLDDREPRAIAPDGDQVGVAVNGTVYIYEATGGAWRRGAPIEAPVPREGALFGGSVDLLDDLLVVGEPQDDRSLEAALDAETDCYAVEEQNCAEFSGAAYVYRRSGGNWTMVGRLKDGVAGQRLGIRVVLDGARFLTTVPLDDRFDLTKPPDCYAATPTNCNCAGTCSGGYVGGLFIWE